MLTAVQCGSFGKATAQLGYPTASPLCKAREMDNYPGMPHVSGLALVETMVGQARALGVQFRLGRVLTIMPMGDSCLASIGSDVEQAGAVVLAMGVARANPLQGELEYLGRGVSYCDLLVGQVDGVGLLRAGVPHHADMLPRDLVNRPAPTSQENHCVSHSFFVVAEARFGWKDVLDSAPVPPRGKNGPPCSRPGTGRRWGCSRWLPPR